MSGAELDVDGSNLNERFRQGSTVLETFYRDFSDTSQLKNSYNSLCFDRRNSLIAQEIISSNAAAGYGISFSHASCETRPFIYEVYPFGSVFIDGIQLLNDFFSKPAFVPENRFSILLLERLASYLTDEQSHDVLRNLQRGVSKTELHVMVVLAEHFFSRLAVEDTYTTDRSGKNRGFPMCKCEPCKQKNNASAFSDTSIGNPCCWHGSLDIIIGNMDTFIHVASLEEIQSPHDRVFAEQKPKYIEERGFRSRTAAQNIVVSFFQRQRHPNSEHFLFPCIAATKTEIKVYFYDSENDILLESRGIKLFINLPGSKIQSLNYEAVLAAWLVVNHRYLCSGPQENILNAPKANFFTLAESSIKLYREKLSFRNVVAHSASVDYSFIDILKPKFVWPSDLSCKPIGN